MTLITRRQFLSSAALAATALRLRALSVQPAIATLALPAEATGPRIPLDFVGLSYEIQQLVDPAFFSDRNTGLIEHFKQLSPRGVLRLGGNTSEFGYWKPTSTSPEPKHPETREVEGEPPAVYYAVTPEAIRNLAVFLKTTGWSCIYGIGMGTNTPQRAAAEAEFVARTLGFSLQYFQIGNEVDGFSNHLRDPKTWSSKVYFAEWLAMARAVMERVPEAKFGIPDVAWNIAWLTDIAECWSSVENPPHVTTLSHHYYFGGPATNPDVNIPNLLKPVTMARVQSTADAANAAAAKMNIHTRMTEGNTCYRGGKPGVSDVFGAALWSADYSLLLASNNYSGINLHGGTGKSVANSVGGFLPGDVMLKEQGATPEQIAKHPHPFYTPIATFDADYKLEPVGYGLKFAGLLSGATFFKADLTAKLQAAGVNATAYAAKLADGHISVIVLNKDAEKDLVATIEFGSGRTGRIETDLLHAPAIDSRDAEITRVATPAQVRDGKYTVAIPHASGVRLTLV